VIYVLSAWVFVVAFTYVFLNYLDSSVTIYDVAGAYTIVFVILALFFKSAHDQGVKERKEYIKDLNDAWHENSTDEF